MSSEKELIVVCDDDETRVSGWSERLQAIPEVAARFAVQPLASALGDVVQMLEERRAAAREGRVAQEGQTVVDQAAILIVDYDLLKLIGSTTGERISYLARCYSSCELIVGLNQFGQNYFDLSLKGHPESFADLNLGSDQLDSRGLWTQDFPLFRPWVWPTLPIWLEKHRLRMTELADAMEEPILGYLGLDAEELSRTAKQFIEANSPATVVTFSDFVRLSPSAARPKDVIPPEMQRSVASARISKWVERMVLAGQDILVDAPHLVARFPSLLATNAGALDLVTSLAADPPPGIRAEEIGGSRYQKGAWVSRSAWYWRILSNDEGIPEVLNPWEKDELDRVFCEDVSRFLMRSGAREFVADLPTPFVRRFVVDPGAGESEAFREAVTGIAYRPIERLSL